MMKSVDSRKRNGASCLRWPNLSSGFGLFLWGPIIWQIVATEKTTGKRVLLATADNEAERAMILRQERKEKRYETVKAVRVWN